MKYLNDSHRVLIEWLLNQGYSRRGIAIELGIPKSTIIYEVKNKSYDGEYIASKAIEITSDNLSKRGREILMMQHMDLLIYIENNYDKKDYGLKQIIKDWKKLHPDAPSLATLYNWVPKGLFSDGFEEKLLRPRKSRERHITNWKRMVGRPIDLRKIEQNMNEFGHWEADFVVGGQTASKEYVFTLVEKKSRFGITQKFKSKNADDVVNGLRELLSAFNSKIFKSITFDNGMEFSYTPELENEFDTKIYFAHPYSSFERGQNENWNSMLRRFFPKGTDFSKVTQGELNEATYRINNMKRDSLGWKSANEVFENYMEQNGFQMYADV